MSVLDWLLAGDPAIQWQALRDLADADPAEVAAARARVAREGLGAALLAAQGEDGAWHLAGRPDWHPTLFSLLLLRATGVDPEDAPVVAAVARLERGFRWDEEFGAKPFFEGEVEPCINGHTLALGGTFGRPSAALARRLLDDQLADGGWNCEAPRSARASFHSTICVLEGLLSVQGAVPFAAEVGAARRRGEAYLVERHLFRRRSTGEVAHPDFVTPAFPTMYRYDVLRGLDYFRTAGLAPDERLTDAVRLVTGRRLPDGRWPLEASHTGGLTIPLGESGGEPSRWITLRALRVLRWFDERRR